MTDMTISVENPPIGKSAKNAFTKSITSWLVGVARSFISNVRLLHIDTSLFNAIQA